jgi:hypothetical protein
VYPPADIAALWSNIPTERELDKADLAPFVVFLTPAKSGDVVVLQGEFSASFLLVDFCLQNNLAPISAVTRRVAQEIREGEVVHRSYVFEHVCFRKYRYWSESS